MAFNTKIEALRHLRRMQAQFPDTRFVIHPEGGKFHVLVSNRYGIG